MLDILFSLYIGSSSISSSENSELFLNEFHTSYSLSVSPTVSKEINSDRMSAGSFYSIDENSGVPLFSLNENKELPMASLTKLMTALIILENHTLDEMVIVSRMATEVEGVRAWLLKGEELSVGNLLKALLIPSANDAAIALAEHHSGTLDVFVKEMNTRAQELAMTHTSYKNPHGLDDDGHYSSSKDLLMLVKMLWNFPVFQEIVAMKKADIHTSYTPKRTLRSTNKLLSEEVRGVKTGTTKNAGQCLLLYVEKDRRSFFTVVLGSENRYDDSTILIDGIFEHIIW
ncbi:D-alanyl-D-alanine carboxypeptidase [Candidatus Peregrinibacteria bacterium]|jgi:serine-type D-Ala-D-Ala carboxypeptidase (penicillin-binding protein 5/6)|nr:D-alanyl-D-alanine carboxypeptidase [Candidatus Peregrinibacteria bacterium]